MKGKGQYHAMFVLIVVVGVLVRQTTSSSPTPNTWWECMANCPGYNCQSFPLNLSKDACTAYCAGACAIPPSNLLDDDAAAGHYCNLGCTSSRCFKNLDNKAAAGGLALTTCVKACSRICSTTKHAAVA